VFEPIFSSPAFVSLSKVWSSGETTVKGTSEAGPTGTGDELAGIMAGADSEP